MRIIGDDLALHIVDPSAFVHLIFSRQRWFPWPIGALEAARS
jgi:hypothetical protein